VKLKKRINIENKDILGVDKLKERHEYYPFTAARSLSFIFWEIFWEM